MHTTSLIKCLRYSAFLYAFLTSFAIFSQNGPGGVGNTDGATELSLWLRADRDVFSDAGITQALDSDPVVQWNDLSGYGNDASVGASSPLFQTFGQNGMPNLNFDATQDLDFSNNGFANAAAARSAFIVAEYPTTPGGQQYFFSYGPNLTSQRYALGLQGNALLVEMQGDGLTSTNLVSQANTFIMSTIYPTGGGALSSSSIFIDGLSSGFTGGGSTPNTTLSSGSVGELSEDVGLSFDGDIYEVIYFNNELNSASRTIIENYLAAKYAIDITGDLYAGDTAPSGDYDFDVAGIGVEADGIEDVSASTGLYFYDNGFLNDPGDYALFGHSGVPHGEVQTDLPGGYSDRWARDWYVDYQGAAGGNLVDIEFNFNDAGIPFPDGATFALVSRNTTSGPYTVETTGSGAGGIVTFSIDISTIADGHYYTIAYDIPAQNSLAFDGIDDFVDIPDAASLDITGALTLETWVKFNEAIPAEDVPLVSKWNENGGGQRSYLLQLNTSGDIQFAVSATGLSTTMGTDISAIAIPFTFQTGRWYHIAGVFNPGASLQIYLNGELLGEETSNMVSSIHSGTSGGALAAYGNSFDNNSVSTGGALELDEVRIWSTNLDQATIQSQIDIELSGSEGNLEAYYDFNTSSGTTVFDLTPNANDGTLFNDWDDAVPADGSSTGPIWTTSTVFDIDVLPPYFVPGYPQINNLGVTDFDIDFSLNEDSRGYFVVVADGAPAPTSIEVLAGTGSGGSGQLAAGNSPTASSSFTLNASGLSAGTAYDVYIVAADDEGAPNAQGVPTQLDVTTETPPLAPTNVIAYAISDTQIRLDWVDNASTEVNYQIERADDYAFTTNVTVIDNTLPIDANNFVFVAGTDQPYYYRVTPLNGFEDATSQSSIEFATTEAFPGQAISVTGTQRIDVADDPVFQANSITIEAWINTTSSSLANRVAVKTDGLNNYWTLGINASGNSGKAFAIVDATTTSANAFSTTNVNDGNWHHLAATFDYIAEEVNLYVDGVLEDTQNFSGTPVGLNEDIVIGNIAGGTQPFDGVIDELRIWNSIKTDYSDRYMPLNGNEADLAAYYPFDEGAGATNVVDRSTNTNDGAINGATSVASTVVQDGVVSNTNDAGPGSLRAAIDYANANAPTTITFDISGVGPYNIALATALPEITAAGTIIDGTTQPGWTFDISNMVSVDGSGLALNDGGLVVNNVANVEIYGLAFTGYSSSSESVGAIEFNGEGADGGIIGSSTKGNMFHGMNSSGIAVTNGDFLTIQGNWFGTTDGTTRSEIGKHGIYTTGTVDNLTIGGSSGSGEGNLISGAGNGRYGIRSLAQGTNLVIQGNYIGTTSNGMASLHNEGGGIEIGGAITFQLGGTSAGQENVISGNNTDANAKGVLIGTSPTGSVVNNIIGLAMDGIGALGNGGAGIILNTTSAGVIVDGNIISSNGGEAITSSTGFGNVDIINNVLGFDQTVSTPRPNAAGIVIDNGSGTNNRFGYKDNPNIIANNTGSAIYLTNTSTANSFATNEIYDNGSGIDFEVGANNSIVPPTINFVGSTNVSGSGINGQWVHLYQGDGAGQGQTFLDSALVSGGTWTVTGLSLTGSDEVVATATDATDGTSEFSPAASIAPSLVTNTNDSGTGSLRDAITFANANPGTTISFDIAGAGPWPINLATALPQITANNTIIDGTTQPGWIFGDSTTMVKLNGAGIGGNANGINIDASGAGVYGLIFTGFSGNTSNGNVYLASDLADNAFIGAANMGNIFHGSGGNAIYIVDGDSAVIQGNRIGTLDGINVSSMGNNGISTTGEIDDLIIGGDFFTGEGNLISGAPAFRYGLNLFGSGGTGLSNVEIKGNKIGTNEAADDALANTLGGINILGTVNGVEIGGSSPSDLNIISGNADHGIIIQAGNTIDIDGNYIGLQSDGSSALGNAGAGIRINPAALNVNIGTNNQNFISENGQEGIFFNGNNSSNTALGMNIFSCNSGGGIGYNSTPLTEQPTIDNITTSSVQVSSTSGDGSSVTVWLSGDGCSNDQGLSQVGFGTLTGGVATINGVFVGGLHYTVYVEDINGTSEFSAPFVSDFVAVSNTNDSGAGSLRAAIDSVNLNPGTNIYFLLPSANDTIAVTSGPLPIISENTIIDATTQPGWNFSTGMIPTIKNDCSCANGIEGDSDGSNIEIYGLRVTGFTTAGISSPTSAGALTVGAANKGNIIVNNGSGGSGRGVQRSSANNFVLQGNYIGVEWNGDLAANNGRGVNITSGNSAIIGGLGAGEGNVISGSTKSGLQVNTASNLQIFGNYIGTDPTGTQARPNASDMNASTGGLMFGSVSSGHDIIGNIISGNATDGIFFQGNDNDTIQSNKIGLDINGFALGNQGHGINFNGNSSNNVVGGDPGTANEIGFNGGYGINSPAAGSINNSYLSNSILDNIAGGIFHNGVANGGIAPPTIDPIATGTDVTGTGGTTGEIVELFLSDGDGQGETLIGNTVTGGGTWSVGSLSLNPGEEVVATITDLSNGTSEFSAGETFAFNYPAAEGSGEALSFDGNNDFVDLGIKLAEAQTAITVEAWINPNSVTPGGVTASEIRSIISEGTLEAGNTALFLGFAGDNSETQLYATIDAGSGLQLAIYSASNIQLNEWTHLAMTWTSGDVVRLYVNGVEVASSPSTSGSIISVANDFAIGRSYNTGEDYFDGEIDEVRVWDYARTEGEIRQNLTQKITGNPSGLIGYFPMDDSGEPGTLYDQNGITGGTIDGATYTLSGAHLGDYSTNEYSYPAGSGRNLDNFRLDNLGVANLPLHIYRVSGTPANNTIAGFDNIADTAYYGVFSPGQTYDVVDSIGGLTSDRRIVFRSDNADPTWTSISGVLGSDIEDNQIVAFGQSGNGQFATAIDQNPYPTPVDAGYALSFDGTDDYVQFVESPLSAMTIETWVKFSTLTNQTVMKYTNSGNPVANISRQIRLNGGVLQHNTFDGTSITVSGSTPIVADQWYHVAITAENGGLARLYVNGQEEGTPLAVGTLDVSGNEFRIGFNSTGDANLFNGEIDEVRVWDVVLTEQNIRDHMIQKIDADFDSLNHLIAYYRFDENNASTATNIAGDNDGTITGATPIVSGAPQGQGVISSYSGTPGILNTAQFGEDINVFYDDATGGIHGYLVDGVPNQVQADGFDDLDQPKYYGIFNPAGHEVDIRMDYNGGIDANRRIVIRDNAADNAASGGWERLSGLLNTSDAADSVFAYNLVSGEVSTAVLNPPSSYPILGDTDPGSALNFAAGDQEVLVPEDFNFIQNAGIFTIEFWMRADDLTNDAGIMSTASATADNGFMIALNNAGAGSIRFASFRGAGGQYVYDGNTGTNFISDNDWHHIAIVSDGSTVTLYLDGDAGTDLGGSYGALATGPATNTIALGGYAAFAGSSFNGDLDEIRIWNAAVSSGDVAAFATTTDISTHPNYADMVAYYKFDEGTGSTIVEDVFSNKDGVLTGMDENTDWVPSGALAGASSNPFITTWSTSDGQIIIPTDFLTHTYNYDVSWTNLTNPGVNEGSLTGETGDATLSPLENGSTYQIEISGDFPAIFFDFGSEVDKILTIEQWGDNPWVSMQSAFRGCTNLLLNAGDAPDLSAVTDMRSMFQNASSFNGDVSSWDVSNVTLMSFMLSGASSFDQDLGAWDVANVFDMDGMLDSTALSVTNYDATLGGWSVQSLQSSVTLGADGLVYSIGGQTARDILTNPPNDWVINGDMLESAGNTALEFDGSAQFVSIADAPQFDIDTDWTIEAWIKTPPTGQQNIVTQVLGNTGYAFFKIGGTLYLQYYSSGGFQNSTTALAVAAGIDDDQWHHVAVSQNGSNGKIYVDGSPVLDLNVLLPIDETTGDVRFGQDPFVGAYTGLLDEVRFWDYQRSDTEILDNYDTELVGNEAGLVAYYPFNDGSPSTTVTDQTGNGNDGTLNSMDENTDWVTGPALNPANPISNYALGFDGVDDYLNAPSAAELQVPTAITIEAWVKRSRLDAIDIILEKGGDWTQGETNYGMGLHDNANNNMFYFYWNGGGRGTDGVGDFNWHHYAVVAEEGNPDPQLYIDGLIQTIDHTFGNATIDLDETTTKDLHIGAQVDPGFDYFGMNVIDEVRIWDYARTESEIQNNQNNFVFGNEAGLVAYYSIADGPGSTIVTEIVAGNDAALNNMDENTDWVEGPSLSPPIPAPSFFEAFESSPLPTTSTNGYFIIEEIWLGQGVLESGSADALGAVGNAMQIEPAGGNFLQTPAIDMGNTISFGYKGDGSGGNTYEVFASSDGGTTFDIPLPDINPTGTYQQYSESLPSNYEGPVRISYSSGPSPLFVDDMSIDGEVIRPDVTITTLPVGDQTYAQGEQGALLYKVQADVSGAVAAFEGLYLVISGADSLDFELDGFKYYQNIGTDDFGSAVLIDSSSWNPGSPIPGGAIGQLWTDFYADGASIFYYVTADISASANLGTFTIDVPDVNNFGFGDSEKFDGGLTGGDNFTIQAAIPDATFVTIPVTGGDVNQGSSDNLIYKFTISASGGDITKQGMIVSIGGDAVAGDFSANGWKLYESANTDTGIGGATLVGSTNIGDVAPDSIGFAMSGTIVDGDTHYFYIAVDIDAAAIPGHTFNVILWNGDPTETIGIMDPKNKVDGGFVDGQTFTIQGTDTTSPTPLITTNEVSPTNANPIPVEIDFGEVVTGFDASDLTVGNGTATNFTDVDGQNFTVDIVPAADGLVTVDIAAAVAQDGAANDNLAATQFTIVFDGTGPSIAFDQDGLTVNNTNITGTTSDASDTLSISLDGGTTLTGITVNGDGTWLYDLSGDANYAGEGTYTVYLEASDTLGNQTIISAGSLTIDQSGPAISFDQDGQALNVTNLTGTISDASDAIQISVDGGTTLSAVTNNGDSTWTYDLSSDPNFVGDGAYTIYLEATDTLGNQTIVSTGSVTIDQTGPTISFDQDGQTLNVTDLTGTISDASDVIQISVDAGTTLSAVTNNGDGTWTYDLSSDPNYIGNGAYSIYLDASDSLGNQTIISTGTVTIDLVGPVITFDQDGITTNNTNISGTISDPSDVMLLSLDAGTTLSSVTNNGDGTWSYDLSGDPNFVGDGLYSVYLDAVDTLANQTIESGGTITIDQTAPIIEVDLYGTSITSPQVTGIVDDLTASIEVTVNGETNTATNVGDGTWILAAGILTDLADGTYEVVATATDLAGNVGTDQTTEELVISQDITALKATQITATSFRANWSEGLDVSSYQLDVSTESDFSSFLPGYEDLTVSSTNRSSLVTGLDFATTYYYRVRLVNTASQVSGNSNTRVVKTSVDPPTLADSLALVQIYDAINPQGLNWETARLRNWDGVTLDNNRTRVNIVNISATQSAGDMPNPFTGDALDNGGLSNMTGMDVSSNEITSLMDFSATAVSTLVVSNNSLEFDDLEPLVAQGISTLNYADQSNVKYNQTTDGSPIEVRYANDYVLSIGTDGLGIGGSANVYTWYRNEAIISSGDDFTITGSEAVIQSIDYDNMGRFRSEVTSTLVPDLTIEVEPQTVWAVADMVVSVVDGNGDPLTDPLDGYMLEAVRRARGFDTLEVVLNAPPSTFTFPDVVLGDYITAVNSNPEKYIPTYFGDVFQWTEADILFFRSDDVISMVMTEVPPPTQGPGNLDVLIEEDFGEDDARIDARRRAAKRKCGLRRKRSGGRTGQDDDDFELIAYGETDDNGEFKFGFLPSGTYRFFVEYPGIPLDESSFVQFDVGEEGISDTDFKLQAFATEDGIQVEIEAVLGIILEYFKDLQIFPNPSSDYLSIRYRHLKSGDVSGQLVDLAGNTMWSTDLRNGFDGELKIDVSGFEEGIYILRFFDRESPTENVVSFRVIVRK